MRLSAIWNGLLLAAAWLLGLAVLYISAITGLAAGLVWLMAGAWTLTCLGVFRASVTGPAIWRKGLPVLVLGLSIATCYWSVNRFRQQYLPQHGPPKRYYAR